MSDFFANAICDPVGQRLQILIGLGAKMDAHHLQRWRAVPPA